MSKLTLLERIANSEVLKAYHEKAFDIFINVSENEGVPVFDNGSKCCWAR